MAVVRRGLDRLAVVVGDPSGYHGRVLFERLRTRMPIAVALLLAIGCLVLLAFLCLCQPDIAKQPSVVAIAGADEPLVVVFSSIAASIAASLALLAAAAAPAPPRLQQLLL